MTGFKTIFIIIGCPSIVRCDCGTENTSLAACHMAMRHNHRDEWQGEKSFRYGSSTTNTVKSNETSVLLYTNDLHTYLCFRGLKVGGLS